MDAVRAAVLAAALAARAGGAGDAAVVAVDQDPPHRRNVAGICLSMDGWMDGWMDG